MWVMCVLSLQRSLWSVLEVPAFSTWKELRSETSDLTLFSSLGGSPHTSPQFVLPLTFILFYFSSFFEWGHRWLLT